MRFVPFSEVKKIFEGKRVAVVGSGPGSLDNLPGFVDGHEVVVRVNNYKTGLAQGFRADVHSSFYGGSIRKTAEELRRDGVKLCLCKCPNSKPLQSVWHEANGKTIGIDFRYIYENRKDWWFGPTFVPDNEHFLRAFEILGKHIPTSGFSAILDVLDSAPGEVYLTGFDFFSSGLHNVNEAWRPGRADDPIGHRPELEKNWLREMAAKVPLKLDARLTEIMRQEAKDD